MKTNKTQNKFQVAVQYLTEHAGVKGAVITDREGLVVIQDPVEGFDGEMHAAVGLDLISLIDRNLGELAEPGCEFLTIKTGADWLTLGRASIFYLIVKAQRETDELLNVRISRAIEMISLYMTEKYPALLLDTGAVARKSDKKLEVSNV